MGLNGNAWFEIGTQDRATSERFYGQVFGWQYADDTATSPDGLPYRLIATGDGEAPTGGLAGQGSDAPYAVFALVVADTPEACRRAESSGGKVLVPPQTTPSGLTWAHLLDPDGNRFGVFTPPAG